MPIRSIITRALTPLVAVLAIISAATPARADEVLHFDLKTLELGPISDDQSIIRAFPFTNTSTRTVRVSMSYCHFCAAPILDKPVLKPGESATVVLELDPTGKRGPYSASVAIAEEGRPDTSVDVAIKAEVCPRVWVEPINMFPHIIRGRPLASTFTVIGRSQKFAVDKVTADLPGAEIDIAPATDIQDCGSTARRQEITVRFPKDMPLGRFGASLVVLTNDEQARPKSVTIDGLVTGRFSFEPTTIGARLTPGEPFMKSFEVIADSGPLVLSSIDVEARDEAENIALDTTPTANPNRVRITVSGRAPFRERQAVDIRLRVAGTTLAEPGEESITVPITLVVFAKSPNP